MISQYHASILQSILNDNEYDDEADYTPLQEEGLTHEQKTILTELINESKGIKVKNFTKNQKLKCISNASGSNLIVGSTYYFLRNYSGGSNGKASIFVSLTPGGPQVGGWGYSDEFASYFQNKEELEQEINELNNQISEIQMKLDFLKESGEESWDEDLFKAFSIMKELNLGSIEKAKNVVKILNK